MAPTACFKRMFEAIDACDWDEAGAAADDLGEWVKKGGFLPDQLGGCGKWAMTCLWMILDHVKALRDDPVKDR